MGEDEEVKSLLRDILVTQRDHLRLYRELAEKSLGLQESGLERQKTQIRNARLTAITFCLGVVLILWSVIGSR